MSLNSALVDKARRVVDTPTPVKVEGTTQFETLTYPWFRCRLSFGLAWSRRYRGGREAADPQGGHEVVSRNATLLCGIKDVDGNLLAISPADRIEVASKELGSALYNVTGSPDVLRKKRRVIGWSVVMERVEEDEFTPALP